MTFTESIRTCMGNYATFDGRAARPEFWWFYLFNQLISGIPTMMGMLLVFAGLLTDPKSSGLMALGAILMIIGVVIGLVFLTPLLAVGSRRLHDRNLTGWLQLLLFVSGANVVVLVFWALPGDEAANSHGPVP